MWLVGNGLAASLLQQGFHVKGSTTTKKRLKTLAQNGIEGYLINLNEHFIYSQYTGFFECEVLIQSSNIRISGHGYLTALKDIHKNAGGYKVIFISSTSVYEDSNAIVDELTKPCPKKDSGRLLL